MRHHIRTIQTQIERRPQASQASSSLTCACGPGVAVGVCSSGVAGVGTRAGVRINDERVKGDTTLERHSVRFMAGR